MRRIFAFILCITVLTIVALGQRLQSTVDKDIHLDVSKAPDTFQRLVIPSDQEELKARIANVSRLPDRTVDDLITALSNVPELSDLALLLKDRPGLQKELLRINDKRSRVIDDDNPAIPVQTLIANGQVTIKNPILQRAL